MPHAALAAAERPQGAIQRQIAQAHRRKITQARSHLLEHHAAHVAVVVGSGKGLRKNSAASDRPCMADRLAAMLQSAAARAVQASGRSRVPPQPGRAVASLPG